MSHQQDWHESKYLLVTYDIIYCRSSPDNLRSDQLKKINLSIVNNFKKGPNRPGFSKISVYGYPFVIYQFAREPHNFHIIQQQKTRCINPKPRLKSKKKGLLRNLNRLLTPNSIEDQRKKRSTPQPEWDFLPEFD